MNQILITNKKNYRYKKVFVFQLYISIIIIFIIIYYLLNNYITNYKLEKYSKLIDSNLKIFTVYESNKNNYDNRKYLGKIYIKKINLEYVVFNNFNDSLLKIAPCKFYGSSLKEKGNICIAGHNYNDNRFFSRLNELKLKDIIEIEGLDGNKYQYIIYKKFETDEKDLTPLKNEKEYEITLLTCNNTNKKRLIIKGFRNVCLKVK